MEKANLYSDLAGVCAKFYDLVNDADVVAEFIDTRIKEHQPKKVLFIGGFFSVAKRLIDKGYELTVADYTDEMVEEGKQRLPGTEVVKADIRDIPFEDKFDAVLVIGRVFTHMYTEDDMNKALSSIKKSLKQDSIVMFDNYEDTKIQVTDYFNGKVQVNDKEIEITRDSTTEKVSDSPYIVKWKATYTVTEDGKTKEFTDEIDHRAFSRGEIKDILEKNGFKQLDSGDNFDETSFYTIARST